MCDAGTVSGLCEPRELPRASWIARQSDLTANCDGVGGWMCDDKTATGLGAWKEYHTCSCL